MLQIYIYMMPYIYGNFELFFVSRFLFFKYHLKIGNVQTRFVVLQNCYRIYPYL